MSVSLTGKDTFILDGRIFKDFADGDTTTLTFPNDLSAGKTGKNGNTIVAYNSQGQTVDLVMRILRGSGDDKFLNSRTLGYINDPAGFVPLVGQFIKRVGDGGGAVTAETYNLTNVMPVRIPDAKENVEGDTEQAVAIWTFRGFGAKRALS